MYEQMNIYLTLKCNQRCAYCVNRHNLPKFRGDEYKLQSVETWLSIINAVGLPVVITGGEPMLYPNLIPLVEQSPKNRPLNIYTNLTMDPSKLADVVSRPDTGLLVSYHPKTIALDKFMTHLAIMMRNPQFHGHVHIVDTPENKDAIAELRSRWPANPRWLMTVAANQYKIPSIMLDGHVKRVNCMRSAILVAPDGVRYPCVTRLLQRRGALEDLKKEPLGVRPIQLRCDECGQCSPCDVASTVSCTLVV